MQLGNPCLQLADARVRFGEWRALAAQPVERVLGGVELRLERGMRLGVLGLNGSGKSTLLSALDGTLAPRSGRLRLGRGGRGRSAASR